jgi:hypothetical protein
MILQVVALPMINIILMSLESSFMLVENIYSKGYDDNRHPQMSVLATWVPDMFCKLYLVKNDKMFHKSTITEAREKKIGTDLKF